VLKTNLPLPVEYFLEDLEVVIVDGIIKRQQHYLFKNTITRKHQFETRVTGTVLCIMDTGIQP
jgi:hypothetical protein